MRYRRRIRWLVIEPLIDKRLLQSWQYSSTYNDYVLEADNMIGILPHQNLQAHQQHPPEDYDQTPPDDEIPF